MTVRIYKKIDAWECQDENCGMVVVSKDAHNKWHNYRDENGLAPLSKDAHANGGENRTTTRLRSDGEWPV